MPSAKSESPRNLPVVAIDHGQITRTSPAPTLRAAGHCVFSAFDGVSALALLDQYPGVELLITKPRSGDVDGPELIRQARLINPTIAILHISDVQGCLDGIPSDVTLLIEPFTQGQLLTIVADLMASVHRHHASTV